MCSLSASELRAEGFEPTGEESPVSDTGELWSNGYEIVCDETATVIDGNHHADSDDADSRYEYPGSGNVKLIGGFLGSYDWGHEDNRFYY